ncbi:MAG TPA: FtsX-like permease family protein [Chryseosolibacter sp.]
MWNSIKYTARQISKGKFYFLINVVGLSTAMCITLVLLQIVFNELDFDRFHAKIDQIYQVEGLMEFGGEISVADHMSSQFGPQLQNAAGRVKSFTRFKKVKTVTISADEQNVFYEDNVAFADPDFNAIFSFPTRLGNSASFHGLNKALITEKLAQKYFNDQSPVGKTLLLENQIPLSIVGVLDEIPTNSTIQFDMLITFETIRHFEAIQDNNIKSGKIPFDAAYVGLGGYKTFVCLDTDDKSAIEIVENQMRALIKSNGFSDDNTKYFLQPFSDLHSKNSTLKKYIPIISFIGIGILVLALLNFIIISVAKFSDRIKEVCVKKIMGAAKSDLVLQFYFETFFVVLVSLCLSIGLLELSRITLLPSLGLNLKDGLIYNKFTLITYSAILIFSAVVAGTYPSLAFSRINPSDVFRGSPQSTKSTRFIHQCFTVLQFTICMFLIVASIVISGQVSFLKNFDIGLNQTDLLIIPIDKNVTSAEKTKFFEDLRKIPGVKSMSFSSEPLFKQGLMMYTTKSRDNKEVSIGAFSVGSTFFETAQIKWLHMPADLEEISKSEQNVIINSKAVSIFGLDADPVGQLLEINGDKFLIKGVIKDFRYTNVNQENSAMMIQVLDDTKFASLTSPTVLLRSSSDSPAFIERLSTAYRSSIDKAPFTFSYVDAIIDSFYEDEKKVKNIASIATVVSVILAVMGLFGFSSYIIDRKLKELGIRKCLGASETELSMLLMRGFMVLVILAIVISLPLSYAVLDSWLENYSQRISISIEVLLAASLLMIAIVVATVMIGVFKAARANPVKILRSS